MADCECRIAMVEVGKPGAWLSRIIYCPRHAAADDLYDVAQAISGNPARENPRPLWEIYTMARDAIAKADGDKETT